MALEELDHFRPRCALCGKDLEITAFLVHGQNGWSVEDRFLTVTEEALKVVIETPRGACTEENWAHRKCLKKALPSIQFPKPR